MKERVCFRIRIGDGNGNYDYAGIEMVIGLKRPVDYAELASRIDKNAVLKRCYLDGIASADDVEVITPEEFDCEFGDRD